MATEQFSLCWDNFHKNMSAGMQSLLESEDLVDVTLAVEGRYLKAHKMVLSVCSPYFRELFQTNPCKHPIVFMKDVTYTALSDLLQFMYQGEVQVAQDNLTTFIKTAEALQIKGLTGDSNSQTDTEVSELTSEPEKPLEPVKRVRELSDVKPVQLPRIRKLPGPASKRLKIATPSAQSTPVTKSETTAASTPSNEQLIQFKMEPYESGEQAATDDSQADDDTLDDTQGDDMDDYSLMDASEDEPKAGTSTDTMGDGQDVKLVKRKQLHTGLIVDGFVYHNNSTRCNSKMRYLVCSEYKRLVCRARAIVPVGGAPEELVLTKEHNHPPVGYAEEKELFLRELKNIARANPHWPLKDMYDTVQSLYPQGAELCPYSRISSSLRRWKNEAVVQEHFQIKRERK